MYKGKLYDACRYAEDIYGPLGYTTLMIALSGSQNVGLDLHTEEYDSDYDFYCVMVPDLHCLIEHPKFLSKQLDYKGGHINVKDLRQFAFELSKQNPSALEIMLTPHKAWFGEEMYEKAMIEAVRDSIKENPNPLISAVMGTWLLNKKRVFTPTDKTKDIIEMDGYYGKAACLACRMYFTLVDLWHEEEYRLVRPPIDLDFLLNLKQQKYSKEMVEEIMEDHERSLDEVILPELKEKYKDRSSGAYNRLMSLANEIIYVHCTT